MCGENNYFIIFFLISDPNVPRKNEYYTLSPSDWIKYEVDWPEYELNQQQYLELGTYIATHHTELYTCRKKKRSTAFKISL